MGKYEVVRDAEGYEVLLGDGNYGVVKQVRRRSDHKLFACKTIRYSRERSHHRAVTKEDVDQECTILKKLHHPNVVEYVDVEWPETKLKVKLYMEFCDRGNLQDRIDKSIKENLVFTDSFIQSAVKAMSKALAYCHLGLDPETSVHLDRFQGWAPVLHRDIKPQNVFLKRDPNTGELFFKLGDFGLGTILNVGKAAATYVGTRPYMAPEISRDRATTIKWTEKCDVFSLGCTLYALCMLKPPFEWRMEKKSEQFTPISDIYTPYLRKIINTCLDFEPEKRPDAMDLADQIWSSNLSPSEYYGPEVLRDELLDRMPSGSTVERTLQEMEESLNARAFNQMLEEYNELQQQMMIEDMEMQKARSFWNPLESMSKKDATS